MATRSWWSPSWRPPSAAGSVDARHEGLAANPGPNEFVADKLSSRILVIAPTLAPAPFEDSVMVKGAMVAIGRLGKVTASALDRAQRDSKAYAVMERVVGTAMQEADQEKRDLGVFDALVAASLADSHIILESMFEDSFYKAAQHASRFSLHPGTEETQHLPPSYKAALEVKDMCLGIEALEALGGTFDDLTLVVNGFDTQRTSSPATEAFRALLAWLTGDLIPSANQVLSAMQRGKLTDEAGYLRLASAVKSLVLLSVAVKNATIREWKEAPMQMMDLALGELKIQDAEPEPATPTASEAAEPPVTLDDLARAADVSAAAALSRRLVERAWAGDWNAQEELANTS